MPIRNTAKWVDSLRSKVPALTPDELADCVASHRDLVVVDIREIQERVDKGAIPGSVHVPRGMLEFWADPDGVYHRDFFSEDKEYVLYCAGGERSVLASLTLMDMGFPRVSHLGVGFNGWAAAGKPVEDIASTSKWVRRGK